MDRNTDCIILCPRTPCRLHLQQFVKKSIYGPESKVSAQITQHASVKSVSDDTCWCHQTQLPQLKKVIEEEPDPVCAQFAAFGTLFLL